MPVQLHHADCFDILPTLDAGSVDMVLADLPYGTTACKWDSTLDMTRLWAEYKRVLKPNGAVVLTAAQPFAWRLCASNPKMFRYDLIWEKSNGTNPLLARKQPMRCHESILVFYRKQPVYNPQKTYGNPNYAAYVDATRPFPGEVYGEAQTMGIKHQACTDGSRFPRSVQYFRQERGGKHPTQKPVALMRWLVRTYTHPGDLVLDNTMGSGTTGVACVEEGRSFLGIELDETYYSTAVTRITSAASCTSTSP